MSPNPPSSASPAASSPTGRFASLPEIPFSVGQPSSAPAASSPIQDLTRRRPEELIRRHALERLDSSPSTRAEQEATKKVGGMSRIYDQREVDAGKAMLELSKSLIVPPSSPPSYGPKAPQEEPYDEENDRSKQNDSVEKRAEEDDETSDRNLVMVFGTHNVRRESDTTECAGRTQRYNKRE